MADEATIGSGTRVQLGVIITLVGLCAGLISTAAVAHYRIGQLELRQDQAELAAAERSRQAQQDALRLQRIEDGQARMLELVQETRNEVRELRKDGVRNAGGRGR